MQDLRTEFAPTGVLRVALNHGNRILVGRTEDGVAHGITVDLARALAAELGLDCTFVNYERAVDVSSSATDDAWDICFLAVDPKRAEVLDFTDPYVQIEGRYLAGPQCHADTSTDLVASGLPVGTVEGSAYSLTLQRSPGAEHLVVYSDIFKMLSALDAGEIVAAAGIGDVMEAETRSRPGARTLQPPFMEIRQAMAIVKGRPEAAGYLKEFIKARSADGTIGDILEANGVSRTNLFQAE
jgi:polar amino acid transport system substrate-binding protein